MGFPMNHKLSLRIGPVSILKLYVVVPDTICDINASVWDSHCEEFVFVTAKDQLICKGGMIFIYHDPGAQIFL